MSEDLYIAIIAFVATGAIAWLAVIARNVVSDIAALARHVLPHFEPGHDEHGRETYEHTLPHRVDQLVIGQQELTEANEAVRRDLVEHMRLEESQYAADREHRREREKKVDDVYEMLKAGNVEIRRDAP